MSRSITVGVSNAISATQVRPALLWYGQFTSGNAYLWTGLGNLSWNSITWSGAGTLLGISNIEESSEIKAAGINVTLSGVPSSLISLALGDVRQGYECSVYMAFFDANNAIISDPVLVFEGRLDTASIVEDGETSTVSITYESRLIELQRSKEIRYTDEEQQRLFSGDLGLQYVTSLQDSQITWGKGQNNNVQTQTPSDNDPGNDFNDGA
jgi:hypothetical protein